jgi:hypothetical protein
MREDYAQEMGLYAPIVVEPSDPSYWPSVDRELTVTLDDVLIEDGKMAPFGRSGPNFVAMGRFGNVMLVNGETAVLGGGVRRGGGAPLPREHREHEHLQLRRPWRPMKLVGGDSAATSARSSWKRCCSRLRSGRRRRAASTSPVRRFWSTAPRTTPTASGLSRWRAPRPGAPTDAAASFEELRTDPELAAEREALEHEFERDPDQMLAFVASMPLLYGERSKLPPTPAPCTRR